MTLTEYRNSLGLTQQECADALGLKNKARLCEIEKGKNAPVALAFKIEKWSRGAVKAADVNPTVAMVVEHLKTRRGRAA